MCASIQYAPSFVTCGCLCESFKHACVCICVYVGGFRTLGLHRVEGPAQELLIERDLRDMAGVSMLQHTETGLWWAVKTSRRLKTTAMSIYAVVCMCVCVSSHGCIGIYVVFVIMCGCKVYVLRVRCVFIHVQCGVEVLVCVVEKMSIALSSDTDRVKSKRIKGKTSPTGDKASY